MTSWSVGGALRTFSDRLFGDDLVEELDPSVVVQAPSSSAAQHQHHRLSASSSAVRLHLRSFPEHQATPRGSAAAAAAKLVPTGCTTPNQPAVLSPDQLQQYMKQLMRHPKLWTMYKEELSRRDQPTHPESVRRVLVEFLEQHGHKLNPTYTGKSSSSTLPKPPISQSIFNGWNMGLEAESTHMSRARPDPHPLSLKNTPPAEKDSDSLEARMKRLMKHSTLWSQYKTLLSQEVTPDDPDTIRQLLIEYWERHEEELLAWEAQSDTAAILLSSPVPRPTPSSSSSISSSSLSSSMFHAFNTDLDGESQHVISSSKSFHRPSTNSYSHKSREESISTTQRQLILLRRSPDLYTKYQERLLLDESEENTPAADLLTNFLEEHASQLSALDQADQEAKEQAARDASLLHLETATLAEEQQLSSENNKLHPHHRAREDHPHSTTPANIMTPDHRQRFVAYRDSISSLSMRSVHNAIGALAGEMEESVPPATLASSFSTRVTFRPSVTSPSEPQRPNNTTILNQHRDSISSRSKWAMDLLAVEVDAPSPTFSVEDNTSQSDHYPPHHRDRRQQFLAYRDSISSRSKRAVDALAGEVGGEQTHGQPSLPKSTTALTPSSTGRISGDHAGPFHSNRKVDDVSEADEKLLLRQASKVADRRRSCSRNAAAAVVHLEPIADDVDEEVTSEVDVSEQLDSMSSTDLAPTMDVAKSLNEVEHDKGPSSSSKPMGRAMNDSLI